MTESSVHWPPLLTERRARFVYEGARIAAQAALAPVIPEPWDLRDPAFRSQFLKVIERQCGPDHSEDAEALHEEWVRAYEEMGWVYGEKRDPVAKTHPDMVPYDQLGQLERDKDDVFVALCEIARLYVYDLGPICPACGEPVDMTVTVLWGEGWVGHARCEGNLKALYPAETHAD